LLALLIHRSSGNVIHDNRIIGNRAGAGVMLTGDDGSGNATATTTLHNKVIRNEFVDNDTEIANLQPADVDALRVD
jgi:3-dehydroshikimate dehydratase